MTTHFHFFRNLELQMQEFKILKIVCLRCMVLHLAKVSKFCFQLVETNTSLRVCRAIIFSLGICALRVALHLLVPLAWMDCRFVFVESLDCFRVSIIYH